MPKILLVEDDVFLREMYVHIFEKEGWTIDQAGDGQEGIDKATAGGYDLVLLDIMLPAKSGIEVLKELRQPSSPAVKTPIILLSNLGQESVIKEAYHIGADGYILKADLLPRQVFDKVQAFLNGQLSPGELKKSESIE